MDGVTRVFLLDDHEIVRRGLRELLESEDDLEVVGEADGGKTAIAAIETIPSDVVIVDLMLKDSSGKVVGEVRHKNRGSTIEDAVENALEEVAKAITDGR